MISRRAFLVSMARTAALLAGAGLADYCFSGPWASRSATGGRAWAAGYENDVLRAAPPARFWTSLASAGRNCAECHDAAEKVTGVPHTHAANLVKCLLCAQRCVILPGNSGKCRARKNVEGTLRSLVYGRPIAVHTDPIEKKPFYHYLPGAAAFSLATSGCPLRCKFCQNWQISQAAPEDYETPFVRPADIVDGASARHAPVIAFTYNEPTVFTEYMLDIAKEAKKRRVRSVLVSCGFMNEAPLAEMCGTLDAIKIDLKGFSEQFYRDVCSAELRPVLRSIKQIAKSRAHLEIVNLVVPTLNDSEKMLEALADWVAGEVGPDVPVHFTRFHPDYQMPHLPPTPVATLERARQIALAKGIHYPYVGNVPGHPGNNTYCPSCGKAIIKRDSFFVVDLHLRDGRCAFCNRKIAGVWR
jgi:pyruvate formate lyase activating enzyme